MYILAGIPHLTTLVAPPLSGLLMSIKIWLPFATAIGALTLGVIILIFMPESLHRQGHCHAVNPETSPLLDAADSPMSTETQEEPPPLPNHLNSGTEGKKWWRDVITLLQMPGLPFCYMLFFFKPLAMISKAFVYQYASYNFHWGLSQTTWLRFAQAGGSTLATVIVLPLLSSVLNRRNLRAQMLDLNVIRTSLSVAAIGFLLLQFSYSSWMLIFGESPRHCEYGKKISLLNFSALFICGLSEGEEPALQGLATSLIDRSYHARLFTSVAVVEIVAKLVGGPMMGKLFSIGRSHGRGSKGLCFSVSTVSQQRHPSMNILVNI